MAENRFMRPEAQAPASEKDDPSDFMVRLGHGISVEAANKTTVELHVSLPNVVVTVPMSCDKAEEVALALMAAVAYARNK